MAHLTLVVQGREVRKFVLNPSVTTIGRAQENDIVINNLALSRRHAEVTRRRGRFEVEDKGSQNGVFVNSERIDGPTPLTNADTITLGTYHFVFSADEAKDPDIRAARKPRALEVTQLEDPEELVEPTPQPRPSPLLVLKYNDVELQRFPITGSCLVGRAKDCDIQIAERRLSRRHCKLTFDGERVTIEDLGSQNGTYVNRRRIPERYTVKHGDILNFAEYSILYLSDAEDYDGPDLENVAGKKSAAAPRPTSGIEREETEFPEAYEGHESKKAPSILPDDDELLHPQDLEDPEDASPAAPVAAMPRRAPPKDPADRDPFVEGPVSSRERRAKRRPPEPVSDSPPRRRKKEPARSKNSKERVVRAPNVVPKPSRPNPKTKPIAGRVEAKEHADIDDRQRDIRPDSALDDWFAARDGDDPYDEEPSVLLERSKSSMSQLLSTMMVDKRELDRNLSVRAKQRKFMVEVRHGKEVVYDGPLREQVTILGRDREADIQIKGRYVAARHSLLVRVKDSLLLVRLGSSSAARVNGLPKLQAFLKTGDVVQIDETTIKIRED